MMITWTRRAVVVIAAMTIMAGVQAAAQMQIRGVLGNGASTGRSGSTGLIATVGQTLIGPTGSGSAIAHQGFWFVPAVSSPLGVDGHNVMGGGSATITASRNPVVGETELRIWLPHAGNVSMKLYDALGREVRTLFDGPSESGFRSLSLDASSLTSESYIVQMVTADGRTSLRLLIVK